MCEMKVLREGWPRPESKSETRSFLLEAKAKRSPGARAIVISNPRQAPESNFVPPATRPVSDTR